MISSLNKALILGVLLSTSAAIAQPTAPLNTLSIPGTQEPTSSATMPPASINVETISAPSIDGLGVLDDKNGGLPATIWKGSTHASAGTLLSWIHGGITHPALRELTYTLLMTQAIPPDGTTENWFAQRVRALIALGSDDKAEQMIASIPASMMTDSLQQVRVELMLLRAETASACKIAGKALTSSSSNDTLLWQKLNIICKAVDGKKDEAMLALDLFRETNASDDAFLQDIVHKLTDKKFPVKTLSTKWSLFDVAIVRLASETDKLKDRLDALPPVTLKYIAADASLDSKLRDKAQGKAIQLGIMPQTVTAKTPPQPFAQTLASDVTTLITSLASGNAPTDADNAVIARLALNETSAIQDCRRVQRLLTLLEVFGYRVSEDTWQKLFSRRNRYDGDIPPAALIDRLNEAAQSGRKGEVILLSSLVLGSADVEKVNELVLLPVVKALYKIGFTKEARSIAHDAVQHYITH